MEDTAKPKRSLSDRLVFLLAAICVIIAVCTAARLVLSTRTGTVDSYYYFARAAELNDGVPFTETKINWSDEGVDRKFFPGYPLFLHWFSLGGSPERVWRSVSILFILIDSVLLGFAFINLGLSFFASCAAVAMFVSHPLVVRWMTMPMAEGSALFYLCLAAILLPKSETTLKFAYPRFLIACFFGGMAILCRAEASYVAACIGLVGVGRIYKKTGWLPVAAAGAVLGIVPFAYWVGSLPPAANGVGSRLHYVNEFFDMFSLRDVPDDSSRGGVIDNFGRSWYHIVRNFGQIPFVPKEKENPVLLALWVIILGTAVLVPALDLIGKPARRFAIAFFGFIVFRSFWYYPYDRFLVTGLPIGFAAMALGADWLRERGGVVAKISVFIVFFWAIRATECYLHYHKYERVQENGTHTYQDDVEKDRLTFQVDFTWFPVEGGDIGVMAARRFSRRFDNHSVNVKKEDAVALEFNWPQVCYGLRPRHVVVGYPFMNFWGNAEYRKQEIVPLGPDSRPVREARRTLDYLNDKKVRYVVTRLPRSIGEGRDDKDREFGTWIDSKGIDPEQISWISQIDELTESGKVRIRNGVEAYEWPRWVRVFEIHYPK